MSFHENNPKKIFSDEWKELQNAVKDASHDYHLMTLSTSTNDKPESRTVVLRHVDKKNYLLSIFISLILIFEKSMSNPSLNEFIIFIFLIFP